MKVFHINGYFSDDMMYQENYLLKGLIETGHEAYLLTGKYEAEFIHNKGNRIKKVGTSDYFGAKVIRQDDFFEIKNALVFFKPFIKVLKKVKPDIIFFHGISPNIFYGLIYKLFNRKVKLHLDFHTTYANSGSSTFSYFYHLSFRLFCNLFISKFDRIYCVAPECKTFAHEKYNIALERLEILPLPGRKYTDLEYNQKRKQFRESHGLGSEEIVFIHTGKMPEDKETELLLKAFIKVKDERARLYIAGTTNPDFQLIIESYIKRDKRIIFLGWQNQANLADIMCGSDVMIQPGSLSQIFIDAICCRLPLILDDTPQAEYLLSFNNGLKNFREEQLILNSINDLLDDDKRSYMKANAIEASDIFDYRTVAEFSVNKASRKY